MRRYEQETRLIAAFKTKKHAKEWLQEHFEDGFTVDAEPRKVGDGWVGNAQRLDLIETT